MLKIVPLVLLITATGSLLSCSKTNDFIEIKAADKDIVVNISNLTEKKPVFYKTGVKGTEFEFFVIKINGEVRAFLNRCRKCYGSGLGFRFDKTHVRCMACNEKFLIEDISHGVGSCYPIQLSGKAEGETLIIKLDSLRSP